MKSSVFRPLFIALAVDLALLSNGTAYANPVTNELLNILKSKNVLTEQEFNSLKERVAASDAQVAKAKTEEAVVRFKDGLNISSGDGQHSIHLGGRVQADYRTFSGPDAQNADTFDIRRAYLQADGKFYDKYNYLIAANFAGSPALVYAYVDAHLHKAANLMIGQFKMPMGMEELTSSRFTNFQERSLAMQFVPAIDRSVMLYGKPASGAYYALSVSNGTGANKNDADNLNDGKDVTGRLAVNFAEILGDKNAIYHLGGSYSEGDLSGSTSGPNASTEGKGVQFFNTAAFDGTNVDRSRYGLEAVVAHGPMKLQGEYIGNKFSGRSSGGVDYKRKLDSYYVALNWMLTGESYAGAYKGFKFDRMNPKQNFGSGDGLGGWELGVRYSKLDASDFALTNAAGTGVLKAGSANQADAWTLGLKWLINPSTRVMMNYVTTRFDTPVAFTGGSAGKEKALTMRAQVDF